MTTASDLLVSAIEEQRPIVLILGQDAWADSDRGDALLADALARLGRSNEIQGAWSSLLGGSPVPSEFYEWLAERFERRVHPPSIEVLGQLPWSAVFTSALDPKLEYLLTGRGREAQVVLTADENPRVIRSRARPPLYYLFSRAGSYDPQARPPADRIQLNRRRINHAVPILNRVLETATTLGFVLVEGFTSGNDWLKVEDMLGAIGSAAPKQVLWFGGRPRLATEAAYEFDAAVASERILVQPQHLGTLIAELLASDQIPKFLSPVSEDAGVVSLGDGGRLETTPEQRLRVEAVASIVDDSWTSFLPPLGKDAGYAAFRRFHGDFEGPRLLVEGVRRHFAIERDFEGTLRRRVSSALADHASIDAPIIVEGQSGTGKSVALSRVVAEVRERKTAAVLYTINRMPQSEEISSFCEAAEKNGAKATLIVCDINREVDDYHSLLTGLRSRGRHVVVVGSHYRIADSSDPSWYVSIKAPAELSMDERNRFASLLEKYFDKPDPATLTNPNILAYLYRFLPASRPRIGTGLGTEARVAEQTLRKRSNRTQPRTPLNSLQQQLMQTGLVSDFRSVFSEHQAEVLENGGDAAGQVIDLVMIAGSLNCPVPVNLLLRAVTEGFQQIDLSMVAHLFIDMDLFRWKSADAEGSDLLVAPRLTLEAQLICRRRLGGPDAEGLRLLELIGAVRAGFEREHEVRFLLNLLQQIGADGSRGHRYVGSYVQIARKLTELRERFEVLHASLMLQESVFRRSAVRARVVDERDCLPLLEEARDAVQYALDEIATGRVRAPEWTKQNLLGERAAIYGFLANDRAIHQDSAEDIWSSYQAARTAVRQAVSASNTYVPLDVGLWTPADLLKSANLTMSQRAELTADIYSTLDLVEPDMLVPKQREKFESRRMQLGSTLQDYRLAEDAYAALEEAGSTAGYFLRARQYGPELKHDSTEFSNPVDIEGAKRAMDFLNARFGKIEHDERCLSLLLEYWWIAEMKRRPLHGQRQPLPATDVTTRKILEVVRALNQAAGIENSRPMTRYLEAVLTWLTGDEQTASEIFRGLARETDHQFRGRVTRRHVVSGLSSRARRFGGRVERERGDGHWAIRVSGLNRLVNLLSRDFPHEDIAYGRSIREFGIAFNFIGPIADPIRRPG